MTMTLMKQRGPNVHEPKTKTVLRVTLMPDKVDLQKPTAIDRRGDTDNAEMITTDDHQQTMYETHQKDVLDMTYMPRTTALANYDDEFAAALATYEEEFADTTLANFDEEFAAILATYDEEFADTTLANYDEEFTTSTLANYDEEFS